MKTGEKASHSCCTATPGHLRDRSPIYYFLFQVARRIASSRHPSWSFPLHESASFLHASASSYRPVWDYLSALADHRHSSWPHHSSHWATWHRHRRSPWQCSRNLLRFMFLGISEFAGNSEKQANDNNTKPFSHLNCPPLGKDIRLLLCAER